MSNTPADQGIAAAYIDNVIISRSMHLITAAAVRKFGEVIECKLMSHRDEYKLLIKRDDPSNPLLPYMTITGRVYADNDSEFYWGHYDMTIERAQQVFKEYGKGAL